MQLERRIAALYAPLGETGIVLGGSEPALQVVPDHRAGVGRHCVTRRAEQAVDRLSDALADQGAQGEVYRGQDAVRQRRQVETLALFELPPDALMVERVLADQNGIDDLGDGAGVHRADVVPPWSVIGRDRQQCLSRVMLLTRVPMPIGVTHDLRAVAERLEHDVDDLHGASSPAVWTSCIPMAGTCSSTPRPPRSSPWHYRSAWPASRSWTRFRKARSRSLRSVTSRTIAAIPASAPVGSCRTTTWNSIEIRVPSLRSAGTASIWRP